MSKQIFKRAFVTGGAGFIGSHVVDRVVADGQAVTVFDNFSTGRAEFLKHLDGRDDVRIVRGDLLDTEAVIEAMEDCDFVFHMAANADVRGGMTNTEIDLRQNLIATHRVLDAMRRHSIKHIAFASSAAVYGEPEKFPTPEDYPLIQTSLYGASKAAAEAFIEAYCEFFDFRCWIFRFVSFMGPRYQRGVVYDFMRKLRDNPRELEVLGDGAQRKSYLAIEDAMGAYFTAIRKADSNKNIFNVGHQEYVDVKTVATTVCRRMGLEGVRYRYSGGERGWRGDSPFVHLDISRIRALGWSPRVGVIQAIEQTVDYLMANSWLLEVPPQRR